MLKNAKSIPFLSSFPSYQAVRKHLIKYPQEWERFLQFPLSMQKILPREGISLTEKSSFVIMDVLVELDDGSYANVEMQKIGYNFPLVRADCYASDIFICLGSLR